MEHIKKTLDELKSLVSEQECFTIEAELHHNHAPFATLDVKQLFQLIRHFRPTTVYLHHDQFQAENDIWWALESRFKLSKEDILTEDPDPESTFLKSTASSLINKWRAKDGHTASFTASFMLFSVVHVSYVEEYWIEQYQDDVDAAHSEWKEIRRNNREDEYEKEANLIREMANELVENRHFSAEKATKAKRNVLAEQLFPKAKEYQIAKAVDRAASLLWIKNTG